MPFWNNLDNNDEPLRQNRWTIHFYGGPLNKFSWALKECERPSYEVSFTEHTLLTHKFKYPSLLKWKPITIKFACTIADTPQEFISSTNDAISINKLFDLLVEKGGYKRPSKTDYTIYKLGFQSLNNKYLGNLSIDSLNKNGDRIFSYMLEDCKLQEVNMGNLSYENEEIVEVSMTLKYNKVINAILE